MLSLWGLLEKGKSAFNGMATGESIDKIRRLQSAEDALVTQLKLIHQLASVEWAQEKVRIARMAIIGMLTFACVLCLMLTAGMVAMVIAWDTEYRLITGVGLLVAYGICGMALWVALKRKVAQGDNAFSATREEISANIALLRSSLWP